MGAQVLSFALWDSDGEVTSLILVCENILLKMLLSSS